MQLQPGLVLNNRDITLRGYRGDKFCPIGANARVSSIERAPVLRAGWMGQKIRWAV